ncbi:trypsin-like peptidase domain-containing protein [Actinosynnema sp. CA-248983]
MIRRTATLLGAAALALAPTIPAAAAPSSPEERAAALARPAIVFVSVTWHGWVRDKRTGEVFGGTEGFEVKTSCSGAVVTPDGHVATASHCVHTGPLGGGGALFAAAVAELAKVGRVRDEAKARRDLAEHGQAEGAVPDSPVHRAIQVERMEAKGSEQVRDVAPATVVDLVAPEDGDVAVLKIPREHLPSMEIRDDQTPVGTPILAIGYPGSASAAVDPSLEPSSKNGQISARRTQQGRPFYEFSAAATHGMSGGPVVDMDGGIVGLVSQGSPGETQSFNFAASSQTLTDVLKSKEIAAAVGDHDRDYRTGLDRYFEGDYDSAVEYFDAVLAGSPGHQQASEYRKLAADRGGKPGGPPTLLIVFAMLCAGIAIATATAGTAVLLTRRKRLAAAAAPSPVPPGGGFPGARPPAPGTIIPLTTDNPGPSTLNPATPGGGSANPATPGGGSATPATPGGGFITPHPATPISGFASGPGLSTPPRPATPAGGFAPAGVPASEATTDKVTRHDVLPVVLGGQPQHHGQPDPEQTERRHDPLRQDQPDEQPHDGRTEVQPGTPLPGQPRPDQPHDGDQAHEGGEHKGT